MTELRMRLIKDGKIVGYEWHKMGVYFDQMRTPDLPDIPSIVIKVSTDGKKWWGGVNTPPPHDSFDLGIKVDDEWWYENDLIEWREWGPEIGESWPKGFIDYCKYGADGWIMSNNGKALYEILTFGAVHKNLGRVDRIGNIYEEAHSEQD